MASQPPRRGRLEADTATNNFPRNTFFQLQAAPRLNQANGEAAVGDQLTWHNEICRILNVAAGQRLSEEELFEHAKRELGICLRKGVTPAELDSIFTSVPEDGSAEPTLSLR